MANQFGEDDLKNLQAKLNAANPKLGDLNLEALLNAAKAKRQEMGQVMGNEDEGGSTDKFLRMLESDAVKSLMLTYQSNPQCVNPQSLDPRLQKVEGTEQQHAWGKPQAEGSVPAGFEQVTMLGPVIIVCGPQGKPRGSALVVYCDGFAYRPGGKDVQLWRFDEVAGIQTTLVTMRTDVGKHEYKLTRATGQSVTLDKSLYAAEYTEDRFRRVKAVEAAVSQIKLAVFKLLLPAMVQRYEAGEALKFGPVTVQKNDSLQLGGHRHAWGDIQNIEVSAGQFIVTLSNGRRDEIHIPDIPNIELLGRLIGVDSFSMKVGMSSHW